MHQLSSIALDLVLQIEPPSPIWDIEIFKWLNFMG